MGSYSKTGSGCGLKSVTKPWKLLLTSNLLTRYDESLPLKLATDASHGVGTVISHVLPDGEEHSIAFTSRSLTKSEQKYSQIDKEVLGLV